MIYTYADINHFHINSNSRLTLAIQYVDIMTNPFDVIHEINCRFILAVLDFSMDTIQINQKHHATILDFTLTVLVIILVELIELK